MNDSERKGNIMADNRTEQIVKELWAMANTLRGNMDASDFKHYILGFMFYRYLSEHQEEHLVKTGLVTPTEMQSVNDIYCAEAVGDRLKAYITHCSRYLGYAIEPQDTWASIMVRIENDDMLPSDYQSMFVNFDKHLEKNPGAQKNFEGVFNKIDLGEKNLGETTSIRARTLNALVRKIDGIDYRGENGRDILGEIYEYLIGEFAANAGKKGGEFYTPHQVSRVLAKLVTSGRTAGDETFYVYDPTMGSGSLLLTVRDELPGGENRGAIRFYGQELNSATYNLARMNLMMQSVSYDNMVLNGGADTLGPDWPDGPDADGVDHPRMFDAVVANPPYSAKWDNVESKLKDPRFSDYGKLAPASKADYAFILHSLYHLNGEGTMAIVLPHGVLFRGAAEGVIRRRIIEKNYLDAVIGLPANLFYGTSIPTTILVFRKNRTTRDVLFIDASKDVKKEKNQNVLTDEHIGRIIETYKARVDVDKYAHVATREEIEGNDYNLNIPRYVDTFEEEEPIDIEAVMRRLEEDNREIAALEAEIAAQLKLLGVKW